MKYTLPSLELFKLQKRTLLDSDKKLPLINIEDQGLFESKLKLIGFGKLDRKRSDKSPKFATNKTSSSRIPFNLYSRSPKDISRNRTEKSLDRLMRDQKLESFKTKKMFPIKQAILDKLNLNENSEQIEEETEEILSLNFGNRIEYVKTYLAYPGKKIQPDNRKKAVMNVIPKGFNRNPTKKCTFKLSSLLMEEGGKRQQSVEGDLDSGMTSDRNKSKKLIRIHKRNLSKTINFQDHKLDVKRAQFSTIKLRLPNLLK
jgi:hypothetical protein